MLEEWHPKGWTKTVLYRISKDFGRGKSKHRPRNDPILYGGKHPFIQTGDVKESQGRITRFSQTYNELGLSQSKLWPKETMCITIAANIAETGILTFPACFPDSIIGFVADKNKCDVFFVEYLFRYFKYYIQTEYVGTGTAQDNINLGTFEQLEFPIPSLPIQNKIVKILKSIDDLIFNLKQINEKLEQTAQTIFKSWFIDFDGVTEFEDSELGEIPKGWKVESLDDNIDFLNGIALQNFRPTNKEFLPVIKIKEIKEGISEKTEKAGYQIDSKYIINNGDILFSWSGSLELKIWCFGKGALNQHIFKVTSKDYEKWFYYQWIKFHLPEFRRIAIGKTTTMGHIQRYHLHDSLILIPPTKTFENYNLVLNPIFDQIISNMLECEILKQIKDKLLPKLMSGEIRI